MLCAIWEMRVKIAKIYEILDQIAPFCEQESWDNSGLLLGSMQDEFEKLYLSLDLDSALVGEMLSNSLVITHHPLIFGGLKKIDNLYPSNLIRELIKKEIKLICMHTNFDKFVLNDYVATQILQVDIVDRDDFLIYFEPNLSFDEFGKWLKKRLNLEQIHAVKAGDFIKRVALCTGSGGDLIDSVLADCFITGDIRYHLALKAHENGISLFDITHFGSECYFALALAKHLQKNQIEVIIRNSINPFSYI